MIQIGLVKPGKWKEESDLSYSIITLLDLNDKVQDILNDIVIEMYIVKVIGPAKKYAELCQLYDETLNTYSKIGDHLIALAKKADENMLFTIKIGKKPDLG